MAKQRLCRRGGARYVTDGRNQRIGIAGQRRQFDNLLGIDYLGKSLDSVLTVTAVSVISTVVPVCPTVSLISSPALVPTATLTAAFAVLKPAASTETV